MTAQTLAERIDELAALLGCTRQEARKHIMRGRNVSTTDGISRLSHHDPTPVQALRNIDRAQRRASDDRRRA